MKKILCFAILFLSNSIAFAESSNCSGLEQYVKQNYPTTPTAINELYQCQKTAQGFEEFFTTDLGNEGSYKVSKSSACILLTYIDNSSVPLILVQDKITGFNFIKPTRTGNSSYGSSVMAAIINDVEKTITRVDFDKDKQVARLTKWSHRWYGNSMIYNYNVECNRI